MAEHDTQQRPRATSHSARPGLAGPVVAPDSGGFLWMGVVLALLGVLALIFPLVSTLTVTLVIGVAILAAGLVKMWRALSTRPFGRALLKGVWGLLYVVAGGFIFAAPVGGAVSLTIVLGVLFMLGGVGSFAWALMPPRPASWGWMLASGAVSMLLGVFVIFTIPFSAFWLPGLVVGVDLVARGIAFVAIHRAGARARRGAPLPT